MLSADYDVGQNEKTALHMAAMRNSPGVADVLLKAKADVDIKDDVRAGCSWFDVEYSLWCDCGTGGANRSSSCPKGPCSKDTPLDSGDDRLAFFPITKLK